MDIELYEIVFTDSANADLEEIYEYIHKKLKEENSAEDLIDSIENNILRLEKYPYSCVEVNVKPHKRMYRKLVIDKYIVLYRVNEERKQVIIFNVIYGKRDYLNNY